MRASSPDRSALVSIVIVSWNAAEHLPRCLEAVRRQDDVATEVVVVDNASTDASLEYVSAQRDVHLLRNEVNAGFAQALNQGIQASSGDFLLSLNPDVTVERGFVRRLLERAQSDSQVGMATGKLLRASGETAVLDSTGLFVDRRRRTYDRGQGEPDGGQYDHLPYAFGACGAAALYRRAALEDLAIGGEVFDEAFFAYYEDADLAWRAQLRGWRCAYVPGAVARHLRGRGDALRKPGHAAKDPRNLARAWRNRYLMALKNDSLGYFLLDLPWILGSEIPRLAYMAAVAPGALRGPLDLVRAWPIMLPKRRVVQAGRTVPWAVLRRWFTHPRQAAEETQVAQGGAPVL